MEGLGGDDVIQLPLLNQTGKGIEKRRIEMLVCTRTSLVLYQLQRVGTKRLCGQSTRMSARGLFQMIISLISPRQTRTKSYPALNQAFLPPST